MRLRQSSRSSFTKLSLIKRSGGDTGAAPKISRFGLTKIWHKRIIQYSVISPLLSQVFLGQFKMAALKFIHAFWTYWVLLLLSPAQAIWNPIISGWNPDGSILRVNDDYYAATSSFEYWPGIPIYHSMHYEANLQLQLTVADSMLQAKTCRNGNLCLMP